MDLFRERKARKRTRLNPVLAFFKPWAVIHGLGEIVALQVIDAQLHQHFGDLATFHIFRDGFEAKATREIEQGFHEEAAIGIVGQVFDESAIDLHHIDGKGLQLAEAGIACAEIIERDEAAERLYFRAEARHVPISGVSSISFDSSVK